MLDFPGISLEGRFQPRLAGPASYAMPAWTISWSMVGLAGHGRLPAHKSLRLSNMLQHGSSLALYFDGLQNAVDKLSARHRP